MSFFCRRHHRRLRAWSEARLDMTHELVEHMAGHRTRLAQEWPSRREASEDLTVRDYLEVSRELDGAIVPIAAGAAGGSAILAPLGLAPAFVGGRGSRAEVAISLGGIVLAGRAFAGMARGVTALSHAGVGWASVSDLLRAARAPVERTPPAPPVQAGVGESHRTLVDASEVTFRYRPEGEAVLRGLELTIRQGDKILLEGASGEGKSTLAALLT